MQSMSPVPVAAVVDLVLVLLFVVIGRSSHGEQLSPGGFFVTFWPFLLALAAGWAVVRAWDNRSVDLTFGMLASALSASGGGAEDADLWAVARAVSQGEELPPMVQRAG